MTATVVVIVDFAAISGFCFPILIFAKLSLIVLALVSYPDGTLSAAHSGTWRDSSSRSFFVPNWRQL